MADLSKIDKLMGGESKRADANFAEFISEFSCLDAIIGADYEVFDPKGNLVFRIRRKSLSPIQIKELYKAYAAYMQRSSKRRRR